MASVRAGVVGVAEVNGPMANPGPSPLWDPQTGGTWAAIWFVIAFVVLFFVL